MKKKIYYSVAIFALLMCTTAISYGQIVAWQFSTAAGSEATINSTTTDANLEISVLERGIGINGAGNLAATFHGRFPPTTTVTKSDAETNGAYYEFSITPKFGYKVTLSTLDMIIRRSATSPDASRWKYSVNPSSTAALVFTEIGAGNISHTGIEADGDAQPQIDLSGIASLQDVEAGNTITFRLYVWGGTGTALNMRPFSIGKSTSSSVNALSIGGTVASISTTPVNLTSFTAKNRANAIKLDWVTASERNSSHFDVLRFSDGDKEVQLIGTVSGNGTSSETNNYSFTDYNSAAGVNYYQLKQVDYDGKSAVYGPLSVNTSMEKTPSILVIAEQNNITLQLQQAIAGKASVNIVAIDGRILLKKQLSLSAGNNNINLPLTLNHGIYVVQIINAKGEHLTASFLK